MNPCYVCGAPLRSVREHREIRMGKRSAVVLHEFSRCTECEEEFFTPEQMDAVQRRASEEIRRREGLLTPVEIRRIRRRLGLSQSEFERLLGAGEKTVVRWERGTVFQNRATDTLMRVVAEFPDVVDFLAERAGLPRPEPTGAPVVEAVGHAVVLGAGQFQDPLLRSLYTARIETHLWSKIARSGGTQDG